MCDAECRAQRRENDQHAREAERKRKEQLRARRAQEKANRKQAILDAKALKNRQDEYTKEQRVALQNQINETTRKEAAAVTLTKQADNFEKSGDLDNALVFLNSAFENAPSDELAARIEALQARIDAAIDAKNEQLLQAISVLGQHVQSTLEESNQKVNKFLNQTESTQQAGDGSHLLGSTSQAPHPELLKGSLPEVAVSNELQRGASIESSSGKAGNIVNSNPGLALSDTEMQTMKAMSECGFNGAPCVDVPKMAYTHPLQTPAAQALQNRIPADKRNDPNVQNSLHDYEARELHKQRKQQELAEIERTLTSSADTDLAARAAGLKTEIAADNRKQKEDTANIQKFADLSVNWNEEAPVMNSK
jgi:hypothetical protein